MVRKHGLEKLQRPLVPKDMHISILDEHIVTFEDTVKIVSFRLNRTLSKDEQLHLYGFYKQATIGDVNIPRPDSLEFLKKNLR